MFSLETFHKMDIFSRYHKKMAGRKEWGSDAKRSERYGCEEESVI